MIAQVFPCLLFPCLSLSSRWDMTVLLASSNPQRSDVSEEPGCFPAPARRAGADQKVELSFARPKVGSETSPGDAGPFQRSGFQE